MQDLYVFDFDGVLADSLIPFERALLAASVQAGHPALIASRAAFLDLFDHNMYEGLRRAGLPDAAQSLFIAALQAELLAAAPRINCFEGIAAMLDKLATTATLCVVTSNVASVVAAILVRQGITLISEISGAEAGGNKVTRIGGIAARHPHRRLLYVGDTAGDMIEGRAAGASTVAVAWGWHELARLRLHNPDFVVSTPMELPSITAKN